MASAYKGVVISPSLTKTAGGQDLYVPLIPSAGGGGDVIPGNLQVTGNIAVGGTSTLTGAVSTGALTSASVTSPGQVSGATVVSTGQISGNSVVVSGASGTAVVRGSDGYYSISGAVNLPASAAETALVNITTPCMWDLFLCAPTNGGTATLNTYQNIRVAVTGVTYWSGAGQLTTQFALTSGAYAGGITLGVTNQGTASNQIQCTNAVSGTPAYQALIQMRVLKAPDTTNPSPAVLNITGPLVV